MPPSPKAGKPANASRQMVWYSQLTGTYSTYAGHRTNAEAFQMPRLVPRSAYLQHGVFPITWMLLHLNTLTGQANPQLFHSYVHTSTSSARPSLCFAVAKEPLRGVTTTYSSCSDKQRMTVSQLLRDSTSVHETHEGLDWPADIITIRQILLSATLAGRPA